MAALGQSQRAQLSHVQELSLRMGQQQIQSLMLMEIPLAELAAKVQEALERNPALEVLKDRRELSFEDAVEKPGAKDNYFSTLSDPGYIRRGSDAETDAAHEFLEGAVTTQESLQEHLLSALRLEKVDPIIAQVVGILIGNLDADGFHIEEPGLALHGNNANRLPEALDVLHRLDPIGCGTKDYAESLKVQAQMMLDGEDAAAVIALFELLLRNPKIKPEAAQAKLHITSDDYNELLALLKGLSPFPGRQFSQEASRYVVPDIKVTHQDGRFSIILNNGEIPVLGIEPFFLDNSNIKGAKKEEKDYIRENLQEARWFIDCINKRNHTLLRVTRAIVHFQKNFFIYGPKNIAPLTLNTIAEELKLHPTTISRAANGKFMQTEWGIYELRHFFSNSINSINISNEKTAGLPNISKNSAKEVLKEILENQGGKPATDAELAAALEKQGIKIARRTVAKYRKELAVGSSYDR
jgi:RNA polymerase sigma-54 factor